MSVFFLMMLASMVAPVATTDTENPDDTNKPVVAFDPDCRKMFYNETLTLTCLGGKANDTYTWYRRNNMLETRQQSFTISSIQLYDRANYQCQIGNGAISDPARQHVITDLTIIRVPRLVFEGDILTLPCEARMDMNTSNANVTFYKDNKFLKGIGSKTSLFLGKLDSSMSGTYKCSLLAFLKNDLKVSDDGEQILITELFSTPEVKISPDPIGVGSDMTLTCVVHLHPLRAKTELEFAFYRNGWHVRGFGSAKTFTIFSVSQEDSGDYACEVRTLTNSVRKMSNESSIQILAIERPEVQLSPNWDKVLRLDSFTLYCKTRGAYKLNQKYSWYKNNNIMKDDGNTLRVPSADDRHIGNYQCQTASGEKSDPVHVDVFFVWLILQVPTNIHEGDTLTLRCEMWRSGSAQNTTFYKENKMIKFLDKESDLALGTASKSLIGKYKCTRYINTGSASKVYTAEEYVSVKDLFSPPEIQVSPYSTIEGADMTLTCKSTLSPSRSTQSLKFAFYKNGQIIREFDQLNKYHVQSVQPGDSGNYTCEVQNSLNTVKKMSPVASIQIQGMAVVNFSPNVGKIINGETMTLTCKVDSNMKGDQKFYWYKDNGNINKTQQTFTIQSAHVNDSGYYQCRSSVTHISEPLRLDVSNSDLILQVPPIINEGDDLVLGCHHRTGLTLSSVTIYKDGTLLKILGSESNLQLGKAYRNTTGAYSCTKKKMKSSYSFDTYSTDVFISVEETFTYLQLKVSEEVIREMYDVVLSCEARMSSALSPLRGQTNLQFAFYKDGTSVQPFGTSNRYKILKAKKTHSGNYTCEVKSSTNGITKMSQPVSVDVQDLFSTPRINTFAKKFSTFTSITLKCYSTLYPNSNSNLELQYTFYKNGKVLRSRNKFNMYTSLEPTTTESGDYSCSADVSYGPPLIKWSNATYILVEEKISVVKITSNQEELEMLPGANVSFKCSVVRGSIPVFTWFHDGKEVGPNCILYNILHDGKTLFITSARPHHSGTYQCKATNDFSSATSKSLQITIKDPITDLMLSTDRENLEMPSGQSLTFTCSSRKSFPVTYLWLHKGVRLNDKSDLYELKENGRFLYIKDLQNHHEGPYQCLAVQNVSSTRDLQLQSNTLNISIYDKTSPYLVPVLIVVAIVVIVAAAAAMLYRYRHRIALPSFTYLHQEKLRVSLKQEEDTLLSMDNMDGVDRFLNSHH